MMVLGRGKCRRGNHHNEQGGEQEFSHACIVASVWLRQHTTYREEVKKRDQERNGEKAGNRDSEQGIEVDQKLWLAYVPT